MRNIHQASMWGVPPHTWPLPGYQTGAIKRIVMTNFMSYNYAAFCPGVCVRVCDIFQRVFANLPN